MRADDIYQRLRRRPFQPFRLHLSNGSFYDVAHPELALVASRRVVIAVPSHPGRPAEQLAECDPMHVTHLEDLAPQSRADDGG